MALCAADCVCHGILCKTAGSTGALLTLRMEGGGLWAAVGCRTRPTGVFRVRAANASKELTPHRLKYHPHNTRVMKTRRVEMGNLFVEKVPKISRVNLRFRESFLAQYSDR